MPYKESIKFKINLFIFIFSFTMILSIVLVFWLANKQEIEQSGFNNAAITTKKVFAGLEQKMIRAKTLSMSLANLGEIMSSQSWDNKTVIKNLLDLEGHTKFIAGGGIWPAPYAFDITKERDSYFFGRDKEGILKFYNDYNNPNGAGYHNEEWYVPATLLKDGDAYWSKSYTDPYSYQPMVTVTVPMYKEENFIGVSTVDIMLDGIHGFLEESMKPFGGYGFLLDRNQKFISYPNLEKIKSSNILEGTVTFKEFVKKEQAYTELYKEVQNSTNKDLKNNKFDEETVAYLEKNSYQIQSEDAKIIASIINVKRSNEKETQFYINHILIEHDPILHEKSLAVLLVDPETKWKLVIVLPVKSVLAQSNKIFTNLIGTVFVLVTLLSLLGYFIMKKFILLPISSIATQLEELKTDNDLIVVQSNDEIGNLANKFNERTKLLINKTSSLRELTNSLEEKVAQRTHELSKQHDFLEMVINSTGNGIMVIDKDYNVTMMNDVIRNMLDPSIITDTKNIKCYQVSHHRNSACNSYMHPCPLDEAIKAKEVVKVIHTHYDADENEKIFELTATPLFDEDGEVKSIIETSHDVTDLVKAKKSLKYQANHDALTNLPNRNLFIDRLEQSLRHAERNSEKLAVLFLDLDNFKSINDSLGHIIGDEVLILLAEKLMLSVRKSDTVARLGGDEFCIIIDELKTLDTVIHIMQNLIHNISGPQSLSNQQVYLTFSIGISVYPNDAQDALTLLKYADTAMYKAKSEGKNNYQFYKTNMTQQALERMTLESHLYKALENNEIQVHYQIQMDAKQNRIIGMEALARWTHPELGIISPAKFIPLAEDIGYIKELGKWLMIQAIKDWSKWYEEGLNPGILSLNLSPVRLRDKNLLRSIKETIEKYKMPTEYLSFEITETHIMKNPEASIKLLNELSAMGIKISIDDFGTGYSSLSYLKKLPIDKLKIDRSFVMNLPNDENDAEICKTIISMTKNLNLTVIAEGVETQEQCDFMVENGCHDIQGYFFHMPSSAKDIEEKLKKNRV